MYQVDSELASDEGELLPNTPHETIVAHGRKRGIIASGAILIFALASIGLGLSVNRKGRPVPWMQAGSFMQKADATLAANKVKFNASLQSAEIYAFVKDHEGHDTKPIQKAENLGFSADELANLKKAFKIVDENKDGAVTRDELHKKINVDLGLNMGDNEIKKLIEEGDTYGNDDHKIQFDAFATLKKMADEKGLVIDKEIFKRVDANKDNFVDLGEAWKMQKGIQDGGDSDSTMTKDDVNTVLTFVDKNGDKKVSAEEAKVLVN